MCLLIVLMVGAFLIMSCVQGDVLCDKGANSSTPAFVSFCLKEMKRKILKDEKKHHGTVDESSPEQQFCKSDVITFVV